MARGKFFFYFMARGKKSLATTDLDENQPIFISKMVENIHF